MPIYGYRCRACGEFEAQSTIDGRNDVSCPECGRKAPRIFGYGVQICDRDWEKWQSCTGYDLAAEWTPKYYAKNSPRHSRDTRQGPKSTNGGNPKPLGTPHRCEEDE